MLPRLRLDHIRAFSPIMMVGAMSSVLTSDVSMSFFCNARSAGVSISCRVVLKPATSSRDPPPPPEKFGSIIGAVSGLALCSQTLPRVVPVGNDRGVVLVGGIGAEHARHLRAHLFGEGLQRALRHQHIVRRDAGLASLEQPVAMRSAASSRSADTSMIAGDLPPSSSVTGVRLPPAASATSRPTRVEPVKTR